MNLDWIKTIPNYINHFNDDHRLIIDLIGIDNYIKLYTYFSKTDLRLPGGPYAKERGASEVQMVITLIGEANYNLLLSYFGSAEIYFSSTPITKLKKNWVIINKDVEPYHAARILDVSKKTIYNWRQEGCNQTNSPLLGGARGG